MAFILTVARVHRTPSSHATHMCAIVNQKQPPDTSSIQLSAAALLLSSVLLTSAPALADERPLVFDHDQTLMKADFSHRSDLRGAIFSKANCKGANFEGADLSNAQLDDANVRSVPFSILKLLSTRYTSKSLLTVNLLHTISNIVFVSHIDDRGQFGGCHSDQRDRYQSEIPEG